MSLSTPNRDFTLLHPRVRTAATRVLQQLNAADIPFKAFEAWRSPARQNFLYAQGRTRPGNKVTFVEAWGSYHQYGLAVDFVLFENGQWSWDDSGPRAAWWKQLHTFGRAEGLERLGFETPHLQLAGINISDLMDGNFPDGGDASWQDNLRSAAEEWTGSPPAPTIHSGEPERPAVTGQITGWTGVPQMDASSWHNRFGGQEWRYDRNGVYLRSNPSTPLRTPGVPTTCLAILDLYKTEIASAARRSGIPPELIIMTIATEAAAYRNDDFTGPRTFRWEPQVLVKDVTPPDMGDYSAGPMQTLASTARWVIGSQGLPYQPFTVAPHYASQPSPAPASNPLYGGAANIDIGTAEIKQRITSTGFDPVLAAAAFNAGGLYESSKNAWRLRSYGDHLDRAVKWYGDACFVLRENGL